MTMMHLCDPLALPVESSAAEVSGEMATFLASQLLPMMASIFPKSANQISSNLQGNGLAYGLFLKGLSARQIREALMDLAERTEFAPTPVELRDRCRELAGIATSTVKSAGAGGLSFRACEMIAEARVFMRGGGVSPDARAGELAVVLGEMRQRGAVIRGRAL